MSDMRELACLFLKFKDTMKDEDKDLGDAATVENMFECKYIHKNSC